MELKTTNKIKFTKEEIKDILVVHLMKNGYLKGDVDMKDIQMEEVKITKVEPGADIHDAYYVEYFDGIELKIN